MGARALPSGCTRPNGYIVYEPVVGCLLALPWAWLAPATACSAPGACALVGAAGGRRGRGRLAGRRAHLAGGDDRVAAVGGFLVPLNLFWATMRFLGDAAPALTLAGTFGWWLCYERVRDRPPRAAAGRGRRGRARARHRRAGLALGFEGQYRHFRQHNPALLDRLEKAPSFC